MTETPHRRSSRRRRPQADMGARLGRSLRALHVAAVLGVALALAWVAVRAQSSGEVRVALVVGNAAYASRPLTNPINDAAAMGETLRRLGFEVIELRDASREQMAQAIAQWRARLEGRRAVGLFYYAGHGVQIGARNYLLPVDARPRTADDVLAQSLDLGRVLDSLRAAGTRMNIVVLDACRDNPFGALAGARGLAPLQAPGGTFIAYATAPGNVALDSAKGADHGLYTQHLLAEMIKPEARIEDVFKRVRFAVRQASSGQQIPWESTSLEEDFRFADGRVLAARPATPQQIKLAFDEEAAHWDRIKASGKAADFYDFLQRFPNGAIAEAAHARLNALTRPTLTVQGAGADGSDQRYAVNAFHLGDVYEVRTTSRGRQGGTDGRIVYRVQKVERDRIELAVDIEMSGAPVQSSVQVLNGAGALVSISGGFEFDPPQSPVPGGLLQVGLQWSSAHRTRMPMDKGVPAVTTQSARIVARERVQVPAGAIDAFRIEVNQTLVVPGLAEQTNVQRYWMAPAYAMPIRSESTVAAPNGDKFTYVNELVRFTRG